jgi:hypothetical protein
MSHMLGQAFAAHRLTDCRPPHSGELCTVSLANLKRMSTERGEGPLLDEWMPCQRVGRGVSISRNTLHVRTA